MSDEENGASDDKRTESEYSRSDLVNDVLQETGFKTQDIKNAAQILEFVDYLLDDDNNLTTTLNLKKDAREQLRSRIIEVFEGSEDDKQLQLEGEDVFD